jgi:hypothetical protein
MKNILGAVVILSMITGAAMANPMSQASGKTCVGTVMNNRGFAHLVFVKPMLQMDGSTKVGVWIDYHGTSQNRPEPTTGTPLEGNFPMAAGVENLEFTSILFKVPYVVHYDGTSIVGKANLIMGGLTNLTLACHASPAI